MNSAVCRFYALIGLLVLPLLSVAKPYVPLDGKQVIERLQSRLDPTQRELAYLRQRLSSAPDNLALAVTLARRYIDIGRKEADPRYLGYAQACLAPWWGMERPPTPVALLRATLLQSTHQFDRALADLDALLSTDRRNPQAWLSRATVLQVQGRYPEALASCTHLHRLSSTLIAQACLSAVNSLNGQAARSYQALLQAWGADQNQSDDIRSWVLTLLAEMACRQGDGNAAEIHFQQALAIDPGDSYLLGSYADFLLDRQRYAEVENLLKDKRRADSLLLRYALALRARQSPAAVAETEVLRSRFEAAAMRRDNVHLREQSRFELSLMNRPELALKLAKENWALQKEPADTRVLLEAAIAAHQPAEAREAIGWLRMRLTEDPILFRLLRTLEAAS